MVKTSTITVAFVALILAYFSFNQVSYSNINALPQNQLSIKITQAFSKWKKEYQRSYDTPSEHAYRLKIFADAYLEVKTHNEDESHPYQIGLNLFSDLTLEEFLAKHTGELQDDPFDLNPIENSPLEMIKPLQALPKKLDWRDRGAVNPVQYQGKCGSCWSFVVTSIMEAAWKVKTGKLLKLSEQQSIDCNSRNQGCKGGTPFAGLDYIQKTGLTEAKNYPYTQETGRCQGARIKSPKKPKPGYFYKTPASMSILQDAVNKNPSYISIQVQNKFRRYRNGVYDGKECSGDRISHGLAVIGWNDQAKPPYWIIKNTWSHRWGLRGYAYILKDNSPKGVCNMYRRTGNVVGK